MAITQGIIDICEQHANGKRVFSLDVEIGQLTNIVPEAVEFCFEACSTGTLLEGAQLNIFSIPGKGKCLECGAIMPLTTLFEACQRCGSYQLRVESGEELRVREIEVDN